MGIRGSQICSPAVTAPVIPVPHLPDLCAHSFAVGGGPGKLRSCRLWVEPVSAQRTRPHRYQPGQHRGRRERAQLCALHARARASAFSRPERRGQHQHSRPRSEPDISGGEDRGGRLSEPASGEASAEPAADGKGVRAAALMGEVHAPARDLRACRSEARPGPGPRFSGVQQLRNGDGRRRLLGWDPVR